MSGAAFWVSLFETLLRTPLATSALIAWLLLGVGGAWGARALWREERTLAMWLGGFFALALAVRLVVPWGPLNFAESERLAGLWGQGFRVAPVFASVPVLQGVLHGLGLDVALLHRLTGPVFGAVGVALVGVAGRRLGLSATASLFAAAVVLAWPAHIRYSACAGLSVPGATLWTAVLVLALPRSERPGWHPFTLAAALALAVLCRPEYRLFVLGLAPLALASTLPVRQRATALVAAGLLLLPYLAHLAPDQNQVAPETLELVRTQPLEMAAQLLLHQPYALFVRDMIRAPIVAPPWWVVLGLLGLLVGRARLAARLALLGLAAEVLVIGAAFGNEENPLFDQWRYLVPMVPPLALGVGLLLDRLAPSLFAHRRSPMLLAIPLLAGVVHGPVLTVETDLQREYRFLEETVPRHVAAGETVLVLAGTPPRGQIDSCAHCTPRLAAAASGAPPAHYERWWQGQPPPWQGDLLVYRGLAWPGELPPGIDLVPLEVREFDRVPGAPGYALQCAVEPGIFHGSGLAACHFSLGWYRMDPH